MTISEKRKKILAYLKTALKTIDPGGKNLARYTELFNKMSEAKFTKLMQGLQSGDWEFHIYLPNMKERVSTDDVLAAAKTTGCKLFHRIWLTDANTGKKYLSRHAYPIYQIPVRRMEQFLDKKMSVPDSDKTIDGLTGQVTGKDQASSISNPEIQGLYSRGLTHTLDELVTVRGGDIANYGDFRSQLEEHGSGNLGTLNDNSISRTAKVASVYLDAMHIVNNLVEE